MASTADELLIKIGADFSEFQDALKQAAKKTEDTTRGMGERFKALGGQFRKGINAIGKWTLAIGGAATAFLSFRNLIDQMNQTGDLVQMAQRLGITTQSLSELTFVARQFGLEQDELADTMKDLSERIADAAANGGTYAEALNRLGLNARALASMNMEEQFLTVVDSLGKLKTQGDKAFVSMELMADAGFKLVNMADAGADKISEMRKEAQELGASINDVDAQQIAEANKTFAKLRASIEGVLKRIAVQLTPLLAFLAEQFIAARKNIGEMDVSFADFSDIVVTGIGIIKTAWQGLRILWQGAKVLLGSLSVNFWKTTRAVVKAILFWRQKFTELWSFIKAGFSVTTSSIDIFYEKIKKGIADAMAFVMRKVSRAVRNIAKSIGGTNVKALNKLSRELENTAGGIGRGAAKLQVATSRSLDAARQSLATASKNYKEAKDDLLNLNVDIETTDLDKQVKAAQDFRNNAVKGLKEMGQEMADQTENPIERTLRSFQEFKAEYKQTAADIAEINEERIAKTVEQEDLQNAALADRRRLFLENMVKAERDAQEATRFLWESGFKGKMQVMSSFFRQMSVLMNSENRKQFEIGKAAAISGAVVDTYLAATKAYQSLAGIPIVGPALGAAAAGAAIAAGLQNVNQIRNTKFGDRGGGGGGSSAGGASASAGSDAGGAAGGQTGPTSGGGRTTINNILQGERFSGNEVRGLINAINDQIDDNAELNTVVQ